MHMKSLLKMMMLAAFLFTGMLSAIAQERLPQFLKHKVKPGETINSLSELYKINKYDLLLLNDFPEEVLLTTNQVVLIRLLKDGEDVTELPADYKDTKTTTEKKTTTTTTTTVAKTETAKKEEPVASREESKPVKAEQPREVKSDAPVVAVVNKAETVGPDGTKYKVAESGYHTVEKGQTFYRISLIYGLSVDELKSLNNLSSTTISVGQKLRVSK